jgi:hypothetical protein
MGNSALNKHNKRATSPSPITHQPPPTTPTTNQVKSSQVSYSPHKYKIAPLECLVRVVCAAGKIEPPWCKVVRATGEIARSWLGVVLIGCAS